MAFRTVVVQNRCKLEYSLNYLICRKGNDVTRIVIDEIKTLVIDSLQVSITSGLINELTNKNANLKNAIKVSVYANFLKKFFILHLLFRLP